VVASPSRMASISTPATSLVPTHALSQAFFSTSPGGALANTSRDGVVGHPIDFDVHSKVEGNESQIVTITLEPGQVLRAESGAMMYMTNGVEMNTTTG